MLAVTDEKLVNLLILLAVAAVTVLSKLAKWFKEKSVQAQQNAKLSYHERHKVQPEQEPMRRQSPQDMPQPQISSDSARQPEVWELEDYIARDAQRDAMREAELSRMKQHVQELRRKLQQTQHVKIAKPVKVQQEAVQSLSTVASLPYLVMHEQLHGVELSYLNIHFEDISLLQQSIVTMELLLPPKALRR